MDSELNYKDLLKLESSKSPYLDFAPTISDIAEPVFILPEGASKQRGRFELAVGQIGLLVMIGASIGGTYGMIGGLRSGMNAGHKGGLLRTHVFNHIIKGATGTANTLGVLGVMYSGFGVAFVQARGGVDDQLNTLAAATATGLLFKSCSGLSKCAKGGAFGFAVAAVYSVICHPESMKTILRGIVPYSLF